MTKNTRSRRKEKKTWILIISIVLTIFLDIYLLTSSFQFASPILPALLLHESTEPYYFTIQSTYTGPNYFFPYANLSLALTNEYGDEIRGFHFFVSLDNSSWVEIPLSKPPPISSNFPPEEPNYDLVNLGTVPLNGFSNILHAKCIFPLQGLNETTYTKIIDSFSGYFRVTPIWIPQSTVVLLLVSVAFVSFIIQILDFWFKERS